MRARKQRKWRISLCEPATYVTIVWVRLSASSTKSILSFFTLTAKEITVRALRGVMNRPLNNKREYNEKKAVTY